MTAFFDTSAVIALANPAEAYHGWSLREFMARQAQGPILISDIVYAEICAGMSDKVAVDTVVSKFGFERTVRDDDALFRHSPSGLRPDRRIA